jgi:uncharacterized protein YecT (DUF1311 family)
MKIQKIQRVVMIATSLSMICSSIACAQQYAVCKTPNGATIFCKSATANTLPTTSSPQLLPQSAMPWWCSTGKLQTPTEQTICQTASLYALDAKYNELWATLPQDMRPSRESLKDRDRHGVDVAAISAWYNSAIQQLRQAVPQPQLPSSLQPQLAGQTYGDNAKFSWCSSSKLKSAEERLCQLATTDIVKLDVQLQTSYNKLKRELKDKPRDLTKEQKAWLAQRDALLANNAAATQASYVQAVQLLLKQLYTERLKELQSYTGN